MKRTAIYMRVSTQMQVDDGDSLAAQRDALMKYIDGHPDMVFVGEYRDDGISGQKYEQRDELQRMLQDVAGGKIDLIICTKMDRLHRSLKHFLDMQEILDKHGVKWLAIWEPMYDTSTPAGQLIINQMMSFAQFEAQNTGQRIRSVMDFKIARGEAVSGQVPLGYSIRDKRLVPNELSGAVVRAFEMYSQTSNLHSTFVFCQQFTGFPGTQTGIRALLRNRKYIGEHRGNPSYCPPIIDKALFDDVQVKLTMNVKRSQKHTYVFSGLMVCAECKHRLVPYAIHRARADTGYDELRYRCTYHHDYQSCSNTRSISEKVLEGILLEDVKSELEAYIIECKAAQGPAKDNQDRIATLKRKVDRLKELYLNELISLDEYKTDKERFMAEIQALEAAPTPEPIDVSSLEAILSKDIGAYYKGLNAEERRFFWRSFVKDISFSKDRAISVRFL